MRAAALALLLLVLGGAGCASLPPEYGPRSRFFEVAGPRSPVAVLEGGGAGWARLVEVDGRGRPLSGPLRVWVQHCPPRRCEVPVEAFAADLVLTCYPNNLRAAARAAHAFPSWNGEVWAYERRGRVVVSAGPDPEVAFLMGAGAAVHAH